MALLVAVAPAAARADDQVEASETPGGDPRRPLPAGIWIAAAATAGLATTTTIVGLTALDLRTSFDRANRDPRQSAAERARLRDTALETEHVATIAAVTTIVAAAAILVIYLTRPERRDLPAPGTELARLGQAPVLSASF